MTPSPSSPHRREFLSPSPTVSTSELKRTAMHYAWEASGKEGTHPDDHERLAERVFECLALIAERAETGKRETLSPEMRARKVDEKAVINYCEKKCRSLSETLFNYSFSRR